MQVDSIGVAVVKLTSTPLLGGTCGAYAVLPYLKTSNALSIPTQVGPLNLSGKDSAQGDTQVAPMVVQWNLSPGRSANAALQCSCCWRVSTKTCRICARGPPGALAAWR
jgi:hypothetical protein